MKTNYLIPAVALAILSLGSCKNDDKSVVNPCPASTINISGNYSLNGALVVKCGTTLKIAAGSVITADTTDNITDYILVQKGGKIIAEGTASNPIVCTSMSKTPGSWAGIVIIGDAPIKTLAAATTAIAEVGSSLSYGGSNATDNSGSLKYVQVLYAGAKIGDGTQEFNGFSFYSVGSGTVLENLVAAFGNDDGFEWYGGTVSAKNLISFGNFDDSFDWEGGWDGQSNSNWLAYQTVTGNFGMEIEANGNNNTTWPKISGISLTRAAGTNTENASSEYDAIQFKKEGNGEFTNVKILGYTNASATAVRIQDANTNTNQVNGNKIILKQMNIDSGIPSQYKGAGSVVVSFLAANFETSSSATGASITAGAWSNAGGFNLLTGGAL